LSLSPQLTKSFYYKPPVKNPTLRLYRIGPPHLIKKPVYICICYTPRRVGRVPDPTPDPTTRPRRGRVKGSNTNGAQRASLYPAGKFFHELTDKKKPRAHRTQGLVLSNLAYLIEEMTIPCESVNVLMTAPFNHRAIALS
jgi:hypothetical protein